MDEIRQKVEVSPCWAPEGLSDLIKEMAGVEYDISYLCRLLRRWGHTGKVPAGRRASRANRWKIAWFREKTRSPIKERQD